MAQPSVSMSDDMQAEVDERRASTTARSEWFRDAILVRFALEDAGTFDEELANARDRYPQFEGGDADTEEPTTN